MQIASRLHCLFFSVGILGILTSHHDLLGRRLDGASSAMGLFDGGLVPQLSYLLCDCKVSNEIQSAF